MSDLMSLTNFSLAVLVMVVGGLILPPTRAALHRAWKWSASKAATSWRSATRWLAVWQQRGTADLRADVLQRARDVGVAVVVSRTDTCPARVTLSTGSAMFVFPSEEEAEEAVIRADYRRDECHFENPDDPVRPLSAWTRRELRSWLTQHPLTSDT